MIILKCKRPQVRIAGAALAALFFLSAGSAVWAESNTIDANSLLRLQATEAEKTAQTPSQRKLSSELWGQVRAATTGAVSPNAVGPGTAASEADKPVSVN